jgi:cyclic pyranopterin phosphate synthase
MRDALFRPLHDLRISVTDRCNLRCSYCMPADACRHFVFKRHHELLRFEEIVRIARQAVALGVRKIRLSGGEPLLRHGIDALITQLAALRTPDGAAIDIALTTNGILLASRAAALKAAGLARVNVSLDALAPDVFARMSGSHTARPAQVLEGIAAAQAAKLSPVKVNMVVRKGENEREILPLVRQFRGTGVVLRFIEYMDAGTKNGWQRADVVPARDILAKIDAEFPLEPVSPDYAGEVAQRWRFADGQGEIGVIASVSQAFCHDCTRLRLSTDGKLYTCLFSPTPAADLREALRSGLADDTLRQRLSQVWQTRADRYSELRGQNAATTTTPKVEMFCMGG